MINNNNNKTDMNPCMVSEELYFIQLLSSILLFAIILITFIGNVLVITAVTTTPNLRIAFNYLILSLSIANLLMSVVSMPVTAYQEVVHLNTWSFGKTVCVVHHVITYSLGIASFFHIFFIAIDRYLSVSRVDYSANRSLRPTLAMIAISWILSVAQGVKLMVNYGNTDLFFVESIGAINELYFIQLLSSILLFAIIFITIIGNLLVILSVIKTPKLQIRPNYLILSLSITDLLAGMVSMPVTAYLEVVYLGDWLMGNAMCHIHMLIAHVLSISSFLHIFFIAIDRYLSVSRVEYSTNRSLRPAWVMIAISWTLAVMKGMGRSLSHINSDLLYVESMDAQLCAYSDDPDYWVLGTVVIAMTLSVKSCEFRNKTQTNSQKQKPTNREMNREIQVAKRSVTVALAFTACYLPYWLMCLTADINKLDYKTVYYDRPYGHLKFTIQRPIL
ncbi:unnamed protein product [Medioppia subpectinata]|uniref:G-protein coupled receptors family 1 profile domain-containing protein n=1 Tax=Medioppia subpectinata TaxID=1979941 RepID=A0A7R9KG85_9ACAR|nr:unnamed protein product [Medioppia subpectinata]CAG2102971.1 unnamed protein product [Medioppia subpectinata]